MNSHSFELVAEKRKKKIKNSSKKALQSQEIIGILYNKKVNIPLTIKRKDFNKVFNKINSNSVINLKIEKENYLSYIKGLSVFPKTQIIEHVDFFSLPEQGDINIKVPIQWVGLPVGVSKGGIIRKLVNAIFIKCATDKIPFTIKVDISSLDINMGLFLRDLKVEPGIVFLESLDKAIINVVQTSKAKSSEDAKDASAKEDEGSKPGKKDEKTQDVKETKKSKKENKSAPAKK